MHPLNELVYSLFIFTTISLWLLTVGYALYLFVQRRRVTNGEFHELPEITVVIAVLNEAYWIREKIEDIARSSYPIDRIEVVIVDGGSDDNTAEIAAANPPAGLRMRVLRCPPNSGKAAQINLGVRTARTDLVVCTDADTKLDRDCLSQLITPLLHNQNVDVVGARIIPVTQLLEEKIHWRIVNLLWCLEGKSFGSAGISGACYAARLRVFRAKLTDDCEDIELAQRSALQGSDTVITSYRAKAFEKRVPNTIKEWLEFRLRRGTNYRRAVLDPPDATSMYRRRLVHLVRSCQFLFIPFLAACSLISGMAMLVAGQHETLLLLAAAAFMLPAAPILLPFFNSYGIIRTIAASLRWAVLIIYVLFALYLADTAEPTAEIALPDDAA